ncbi:MULTISPECIES: polysaccharide deacetylase [unclassified Actinomyces]|uniref:polysaccharide deacetylase family protein n=1 Tax=unclassified Actinomyces TaxID=2609248 RepID=UPI002017F635|nr:MULTISPECIES: polysaccharide deacetylase [unclassified Actinomyces]MCL3778056.1 polysaccharide deacetylase [Actinomyces sp. AC-20-1]MCL3789858.1 polysaccharide deacetylase [Actinomyces sp. 187325]MCL3792013.1 polysaccharide deacetylase [Actinomyces sp. 186855]MCL3794715.1 polysaccharide deacetylase [Actinomyces sp. 217892]
MAGTICLTFHFDAVSLYPGMFGVTSPSTASRGEFGARVGVPRILDLLRREDIPATFFVPGLTVDTFPEVCKAIRDQGHEFAHHGYRHVSPVPMTEQEEREELLRGIDAMERHLDGYRPYGYCSPASDLSPNSIRLLREEGFVYDATMCANDFSPYWCREGDKLGTDGSITFGQTVPLVSLPFSWTLDDFPQMELVLSSSLTLEGNRDPKVCERMWLEDMDFMSKEVPDGVFVMCFHPQVIGRGARIRVVENMIRKGRELGFEFTTCLDAAQQWKAANPFPEA